VPLASDLGGIRGLGPIAVEQDEPVFHSEWERKMYGITMSAMGKGLCSIDEFRHRLESMHPVAYLSASYYARWIWTLERVLADRGLVTEEELDARTRELALAEPAPAPRREEPEFADALLGAVYGGVSSRRDIDTPRRFAVGDRVLARGSGTDGHTRLPAYARGKIGVVVRCDDGFVFPDSNARRAGEEPSWCYCVRFEAGDVWGDAAEPRAPVFLDLWEPYLEPAA
jgi:nitrile hydratase